MILKSMLKTGYRTRTAFWKILIVFDTLSHKTKSKQQETAQHRMLAVPFALVAGAGLESAASGS